MDQPTNTKISIKWAFLGFLVASVAFNIIFFVQNKNLKNKVEDPFAIIEDMDDKEVLKEKLEATQSELRECILDLMAVEN